MGVNGNPPAVKKQHLKAVAAAAGNAGQTAMIWRNRHGSHSVFALSGKRLEATEGRPEDRCIPYGDFARALTSGVVADTVRIEPKLFTLIQCGEACTGKSTCLSIVSELHHTSRA